MSFWYPIHYGIFHQVTNFSSVGFAYVCKKKKKKKEKEKEKEKEKKKQGYN